MASSRTDLEFEAIRSCLKSLEPLDPGQQDFVLKMVLSRLGRNLIGVVDGTGAGKNTAGGAKGVDIQSVSPKDFLRAKKPVTDVERVTVLAYYLAHNRSTPHFKTVDLTSLNTEAGGARFSNTAFTARNAVSQNRYLAPAGQGKKQISALGEDVVAALPDREAVAAVLANEPARKKRGGRPKVSRKAK